MKRVGFVDIHGAPKVKYVYKEGSYGFGGASVDGLGKFPYDNDVVASTKSQFSSLVSSGGPVAQCSRGTLERVIEREFGGTLRLVGGFEPEFFVVGGKDDWDKKSRPCYDYRAFVPYRQFIHELVSRCNEVGINVYQVDHEDANGQFEVNFQPEEAVKACDLFVSFRMIAIETAYALGYDVTFMSKPYADRTGSGSHWNFHLEDADGNNIFSNNGHLTDTAKWYIGGLIRHAPALTAIASPTVNCYKRLLGKSRSGYGWVPSSVSWGDDNRSCMIRVPNSERVEDRQPSGLVNPYLYAAASIVAGMDGVRNKFDPGEQAIGKYGEPRVVELPKSLDEALAYLKMDKKLMDGLGPVAKEFIKIKKREVEEFAAEVHAWETNRYFHLF